MAVIARYFLLFLLLGVITVQAGKRYYPHYEDESDYDSSDVKVKYRYEDLTKNRRSRPQYGLVQDENEEDDDRLFTVGAQYSVAHQPTNTYRKSRKQSSNSGYEPKKKTVSYANFRLLNQEYENEQPERPKPKSMKKKMFKPVRPEFESDLRLAELSLRDDDSHDYDSSSITEVDPHEFKHDFKLQNVPNLYDRENTFSSFRGIASRGQIEKYLEDQQKYRDEAIQLQLLNDPSPKAKGLYHQFLKAKDDERIEMEYIAELKKKPQSLFQSSPRYVSPKKDNKKSIKRTPKSGLGLYRTDEQPGSYSFEIEI